MKKLILLLFLIPNLVMAETWVCSYVEKPDNLINTSTYKRLNNKEFSTTWGIYEVSYENKEHVVLSQHKAPFPVTTVLFKGNKNKFMTALFTDEGVDGWQGDCEVVE